MPTDVPGSGFVFTVLGSGTSIPSATRGPAGFLVQADGSAWLVDGGSGTSTRCMQAGVDPQSLAGGVYSHWHPDHMADLVPLLFSFRVRDRREPWPIWAADGFQDVLAGLQGVFGKWIAPPGGVRHEVLSLERPSVRSLGAIVLRTAPANHSAGALHLRFEHPSGAVVFSGDTGPSEALVELARGADLLVCECAGSDLERVPGHLWPAAVLDIVERARPGRVWLTHLYPHVDPEEAVATVSHAGVPTVHAEDLMTWSPRRPDDSGV
ncbi:MAG: ribonuclease Z [Alphaproteobacteria bacterium]|nr:ribonuclease Z [Alphaproteobacteria bacterium]